MLSFFFSSSRGAIPNKKKKGFNQAQKYTTQPNVNCRKQWNDEQMKGALKSVLDDGISANKAAVLHGVPRSTLKDCLSGRVIHGPRS